MRERLLPADVLPGRAGCVPRAAAAHRLGPGRDRRARFCTRSLPYHFYRGEDHLFLSSYYAVPLGAYLVLAVLGDQPLFARRAAVGGCLRGLRDGRSVTLGLCAVIGLASGTYYYSLFTVVLVACCRPSPRGRRAELAAAVQGGAVVAVSRALAGLARSVIRLLGAARDKPESGAPQAVRDGALRAQARSARVADRAAPDREARRDAAALRRLVARDGGDVATPLGLVGDRRVPGCWRSRCSSWRRPGGALRRRCRQAGMAAMRRALVRVDRRARDVGRGGRAADSRLESAVDLHRVLRLARGRAAARPWARSGSGRGVGGACWRRSVLCVVLAIGVLDQTSSGSVPAYGPIAAE